LINPRYNDSILFFYSHQFKSNPKEQVNWEINHFSFTKIFRIDELAKKLLTKKEKAWEISVKAKTG